MDVWPLWSNMKVKNYFLGNYDLWRVHIECFDWHWLACPSYELLQRFSHQTMVLRNLSPLLYFGVGSDVLL